MGEGGSSLVARSEAAGCSGFSAASATQGTELRRPIRGVATTGLDRHARRRADWGPGWGVAWLTEPTYRRLGSMPDRPRSCGFKPPRSTNDCNVHIACLLASFLFPFTLQHTPTAHTHYFLYTPKSLASSSARAASSSSRHIAISSPRRPLSGMPAPASRIALRRSRAREGCFAEATAPSAVSKLSRSSASPRRSASVGRYNGKARVGQLESNNKLLAPKYTI